MDVVGVENHVRMMMINKIIDMEAGANGRKEKYFDL